MTLPPPHPIPAHEPSQAAILASPDERGGGAVAARASATPAARDRAAAALPWARMLRWLALAPAAFFLLVVLSPPLNHDVAAILNFAERWFAGEGLYTDLIDVNPPLIFVLILLPTALAAVTPLGGVQALLLCLIGFCALSWRLTVALRRGRGEGAIEAAVLDAAVPLLCVIAGYDFGQREHIMAVAALPYCLLAARRIEGLATPRRLALGVAVLAALGFALKPHFLAVPGLVEAVVLWRVGPARALRDPVPRAMAAVWLLYLAAIPVLFPDYFGHVVPLVWDFYLDGGGFSVWTVLLSERLGPALVALLALVPFALLRWGGALAPVLAAAGTGAFVSAWVQHKGWTYHIVPITMFTGALALVLGARWLDRALPAGRARAAAPVLAVVATFGLTAFAMRGAEAPWREIWFDWDKAGRLTAWLKREAYGERLLVLSPGIYPVYPALNYAQAQSTLRTMNLWLLQGTNRTCPANGERYRETWEMSRAEFFTYRTVAEDFARAPPAAVLVTRHPGIPWCGREFDFVEYFGRHPLFAETWRHYRQVGEIEGYRLFVRED
jgi:hypothetical protein